jgi:hypothetical protein
LDTAFLQLKYVLAPAVLALFLIEAANAALVLICSTRATAKMLAVTVRAIGAIRRYCGLERLVVTAGSATAAGTSSSIPISSDASMGVRQIASRSRNHPGVRASCGITV